MIRKSALLWSVLLLSLAGPVSGQTGELRAGLGLARGIGAGGLPMSPVATASFSFVKSAFSFGPEALYASGDQRIFGVGGVARLRISSGRLRPYLIGSLGGNFWKRQEFVTAGLFSGSLGGGISLTAGGPVGLTVETRLHQNLQRYSGGGDWSFMTITVGGRLGW